MKKLIICICFFSGMSFIYSQPTFFFHNKNIKEWYITAKKEKLQEEINKIITISEFEKLLTANKVNKESLFNLFNFVDFDQNGLNDLLFQGKIGNKNYVILFKKKSNEEYTIVFNQTEKFYKQILRFKTFHWLSLYGTPIVAEKSKHYYSLDM